LTTAEARQMITSEGVDKGMIPKLTACMEAVEDGVERAHIIDGRRPHSLLIEVFTEAGIGTMVKPASATPTGFRPLLV
jgi:acetylglutamate kinase